MSFDHDHYYPGKKPSSTEIFEIFPEARQMIPRLLKEAEDKLEHHKSVIKKIYDSKEYDKFTKWFLIESMKVFINKEDLANVKRLRSLKAIIKGVDNGTISLDCAKQVAIQDIHDFGKVRTFGKRIKALCPFHNEKTPSFYIFTDTNSFHCFGCNAGGDVIKFVQKLHGLSFKDAIQFLAKQ